jgi:hypothetical protein
VVICDRPWRPTSSTIWRIAKPHRRRGRQRSTEPGVPRSRGAPRRPEARRRAVGVIGSAELTTRSATARGLSRWVPSHVDFWASPGAGGGLPQVHDRGDRSQPRAPGARASPAPRLPVRPSQARRPAGRALVSSRRPARFGIPASCPRVAQAELIVIDLLPTCPERPLSWRELRGEGRDLHQPGGGSSIRKTPDRGDTREDWRILQTSGPLRAPGGRSGPGAIFARGAVPASRTSTFLTIGSAGAAPPTATSRWGDPRCRAQRPSPRRPTFISTGPARVLLELAEQRSPVGDPPAPSIPARGRGA